jgi:hypothetical protein
MAIGLLGIGSGIGFFVGPQYSGWRADAALWQWGTIAGWQWPCVELGLAGFAFGVLFLLLAREARPPGVHVGPPSGERTATLPDRLAIEALTTQTVPHATDHVMGRSLRWRVVAVALVLGWRDFAGVSSLTLTSIYLQKAHLMDRRQTGLIIGLMMLMGVVANPLAVWLSPGRRLAGGCRRWLAY